MNIQRILIPLTFLFCFSINASAQECVDSDGDGWGWDGTKSCRVGSGNQQPNTSSSSNCVDDDGDGWGWDGTASCRVGGGHTTSNTSNTSSSNCVDDDGDGWGWDGTASCRVGGGNNTDTTSNTSSGNCVDTAPIGDGWGWDGANSCRVGDDIDNPIGAQVIKGFKYVFETYLDGQPYNGVERIRTAGFGNNLGGGFSSIRGNVNHLVAAVNITRDADFIIPTSSTGDYRPRQYRGFLISTDGSVLDNFIPDHLPRYGSSESLHNTGTYIQAGDPEDGTFFLNEPMLFNYNNLSQGGAGAHLLKANGELIRDVNAFSSPERNVQRSWFGTDVRDRRDYQEMIVQEEGLAQTGLEVNPPREFRGSFEVRNNENPFNRNQVCYSVDNGHVENSAKLELTIACEDKAQILSRAGKANVFPKLEIQKTTTIRVDFEKEIIQLPGKAPLEF